MNLYYIKCLMFTKSNSIKIKCRIDRKNNLYSCYINWGFKKLEIIDEKELSNLLNYQTSYLIVWNV